MRHQLTPNPEWGRKGRKEEDRLRGLNAKDRRASIAEQLTPNGNVLRVEGVDRCYCGCKYWENDRCIDCGGTEPEPCSD